MAIPEASWLNLFSSVQGFRTALTKYPQKIKGLGEFDWQRLLGLSDEELRQEMDEHLDLSNFFDE